MLPRDKADFPKMLGGIRKLVRGPIKPEAVVAAVANHLAQTEFPLLSPIPGGLVKLRKTPAVTAFAQWLSAMNVKDAGFWLSSAYSHLVQAKRRQRQAMFFTPPILGDRMLDDLDAAGISWTDAKIIDLACGGAAFLGPAALRVADALAKQGYKGERILSHIEQHLVGIEIDPFLAQLSQFFVGLTLYPWVEAAGRPPKIAVTIGDALVNMVTMAGKFDAVICNPPYRKLTRREVDRLPKELRRLCFMQPNLYGMFIAMSLSLLNARGIAGLLTPMSFLSGQSFLRLRAHLAAVREVAQIDIVEEKLGVFLGVEQDTAISVYSPKAEKDALTQVFAGTAASGWTKTGKVRLDASGGPWILPRRKLDAPLLAAANGITMADYGYEATVGDVVLHRDRRRRFASLEAARRAKAVKPVPMLRASEIRVSGKLEFERHERLDCFIDVGRKGQGLVTKPAVALHRVSSHDQDRRLICAPIPRGLQNKHGGVLGENHVNFLVATNGESVAPELLAQILASEPVDRLFRCRSGATNVSVYELTHLPLPDPEIVRTKLATGVGIDAAVRAGFGMPDRPIQNNNHGLPKKTRRPAKRS
jgi:hypothetical protein